MYLYLRWLICCPNVALGDKSCSKLLVAQKVAENYKSCQKVAEYNLYRPTERRGWSPLHFFAAVAITALTKGPATGAIIPGSAKIGRIG